MRLRSLLGLPPVPRPPAPPASTLDAKIDLRVVRIPTTYRAGQDAESGLVYIKATGQLVGARDELPAIIGALEEILTDLHGQLNEDTARGGIR